MSFGDLGLQFDFTAFFKEKGYKAPTAVQRKAIPLFNARKSLVVLSETGSGKTLAYALPLMALLKDLEIREGALTERSAPLALILAPTRELATQIHNVFKSLSHHAKLRVRVLSGGDGGTRTKSLSHSTYDILVATPSRLCSALRRKELALGHVKHVVMDEADNLFEMGFRKDLDNIFDHMDISMAQLGFFTATLPASFEQFLQEKFPGKKMEWVMLAEAHRPQSKIDTYNVRVMPAEKNMIVKMFLEKEAKGRGIVFTNQRNQAEELFQFLKTKLPKLRVQILHGELSAKAREEALRGFTEKKFQVLVATDIAARGIDVMDLQWVVNYGLPKSAIYYLHRCGRVARGGNHGVVYNLVAPHDAKMVEEINAAIKQQGHLQLEAIPAEKTKPQVKTAVVTKELPAKRLTPRLVKKIQEESKQKIGPKAGGGKRSMDKGKPKSGRRGALRRR